MVFNLEASSPFVIEVVAVPVTLSEPVEKAVVVALVVVEFPVIVRFESIVDEAVLIKPPERMMSEVVADCAAAG